MRSSSSSWASSRQARASQVTLPVVLVQGQHRLQGVLELVAGLRLLRELEGDGGVVLGHLADDPVLRQLLAGPGEGVAGGQLAGDPLVQAGVAQGGGEQSSGACAPSRSR